MLTGYDRVCKAVLLVPLTTRHHSAVSSLILLEGPEHTFCLYALTAVDARTIVSLTFQASSFFFICDYFLWPRHCLSSVLFVLSPVSYTRQQNSCVIEAVVHTSGTATYTKLCLFCWKRRTECPRKTSPTANSRRVHIFLLHQGPFVSET